MLIPTTQRPIDPSAPIDSDGRTKIGTRAKGVASGIVAVIAAVAAAVFSLFALLELSFCQAIGTGVLGLALGGGLSMLAKKAWNIARAQPQ